MHLYSFTCFIHSNCPLHKIRHDSYMFFCDACVLSNCEYIIQVLLHLSMVCNRLFMHFSGQAQFLDRHHLLIKFGSVDGGVRFLLI